MEYIIYVVGYFLAYYMIKKWQIQEFKERGWGTILFCLYASLSSWAGVLVISCGWIIYWISKTTPPKWL